MDGKHTVDVGMLVMPLLMEMIMLVGDMAGVKYDSGTENPNKGKTRDTMLESIRTRLQREIDAKESMLFSEDTSDQEQKEEETTDVEMGDEEPKGLMARRD